MDHIELSHIPVLLSEFLALFSKMKIASFIDFTVGAGGHALALLREHPEIEHFYGFDRDPLALKISQERLNEYRSVLHFQKSRFAEFNLFFKSEEKVDGIVADLGVSSMQMDDLSRGFSFKSNDVIDMRMDPTQDLNAAVVLNSYSEAELGKIFRDLGEEPFWKRCAAAVVMFRRKKPIETVSDFKEALHGVFPPFRLRKKIHPLTLVFQALRMHVNNELGELSCMLNKSIDRLSNGGRIVIISFCSLEDRLVKRFFRDAGVRGLGIPITKKVIMPSDDDVRKNPRCRSAKMRCFERTVID